MCSTCSSITSLKRKEAAALARSLKNLRLRKGNVIACLLCYAAAFAVPVLWQYVALVLIYPWKLAATAPDAAAHLLDAFPFLPLAELAAKTAENAAPLRDVLALREEVWLGILTACAGLCWMFTLILQLIWRFTHRKAILGARQTVRAIRSYRLTLLVIWVLNSLFAGFLWRFGVQFIPGRTLWDYAVSFGIYLLLPLAAIVVSRLAAPPAISGRHAFFKRI